MEKQYVNLPKIIIDTHCHGRDLRQAYKTTVWQTMKEAKNGLISISCFMPNTDLPITTIPVLEEYIKLTDIARFEFNLPKQYIWFGLTDDNLTGCERALEYPEVVGLKVYPKSKNGRVVTTGSIGVTERITLSKGMQLAREFNKSVAVHCDDPEIIEQEGNTIRAEASCVRKILELAERIWGVKILICHISCAESVILILEAQKKGMSVAMELCPHYLWFDSDRTHWNPKIDPIFYHCFNNLRSSANREALITLLTTSNSLTVCGSDNAAHTTQEKLEKKAGGLPSNQELVPVICTLAKQLNLSDLQVANLLSFNASRFLNIPVIYELIEYELEERIDYITYNNGKIVNPWNGSRLLFPAKKESKNDNS